MPSEIDRKIAVIFVADVVGYSKHMEKDENATIKSYNACEKILNKLLKKYKGSVFNTAGDSVLAEFPSAVNAVECGVDFQNEIKKRNETDKTDVKLEFRLGINMGDVVKKDNNLMGDGVNIAARLEALAQPNGISISKSVYDFVVPKTKMTFNDLGVQKVKQNEFHAFDILLDPSQKRKLKPKFKFNLFMLGMIATIVLVLIFSFSYLKNNLEEESSLRTDTVFKNSLPTILVKPFKIIGEDKNSVGPALTESLISTFSQYSGINVLSSNTSYYVIEKEIADNQLSEMFSVDFIVRGTVQLFAGNNRLTVDLFNTKNKTVAWSKKVDFKLDDIFLLQDNIGASVLEELQINMVVGKQAKKWKEYFDTFDKYNIFLNQRKEWRKFTKEGHLTANQLYDKLQELKTDENILDYLKGWLVFQRILMNISENREDDINDLDLITKRHISKVGDNDAYALRALSEIQFFSQDCDKARSYMDKALELGGTVDIYTIAGSMEQQCDNLERSVKLYNNALQLQPNDNNYFVSRQLVLTLYLLGRIDDIKELMSSKINNDDYNIGNIGILVVYSAIEAEEGNTEEAKKLWERVLKAGVTLNSLKSYRKGILFEKIKPHLEPLGLLESLK